MRLAVTVLAAFYEWAIRVGYGYANPWASLPAADLARQTETQRTTSAEHLDALDADAGIGAHAVLERTLTTATMQALLAELDALPPTGRNRRLRFALEFAYGTGLRLSELVRARRGHLVQLGDDWALHVVGKHRKKRLVPIPEHVINALQDYLQARGLPRDLHIVKRGTYLIGVADDLADRMPLRGAVAAADGIKALALHRDFRAFFDRCANRLAASDPDGAARLRRMTAHWLRHSHASHAIEAGVPIDVVRDVLGHASLSTTSLYVRTEDRRRAAEMKKLWAGRTGR